MAAVLVAVFAEVLPADGFVARAAVAAAEIAALVAEELHLVLLPLRQGIQLLQRVIQAEIRHDIAEFRSFQFRLQVGKRCQHLRR